MRSVQESISQTMGSLAPNIHGPSLLGPDNLYRKRTMTEQELFTPAETLIEHLIRLLWLDEVPTTGHGTGLRLTDLGNSLLRHREADGASGDDPVSVVMPEPPDTPGWIKVYDPFIGGRRNLVKET